VNGFEVERVFYTLLEMTDKDKWIYLINHVDLDYVVILRDDRTLIKIFADDAKDNTCVFFRYYIGNSDGIFELCEALGIKVEGE